MGVPCDAYLIGNSAMTATDCVAVSKYIDK